MPSKIFSKKWKRNSLKREIRARKRIAKRNRQVIREWQSEHNGKRPDLSVIPYGSYCDKCSYQYSIRIPKEERDLHVGIVSVGQSHIGGCKLIKKTDDDFDGFGLLWDGCKECGFKHEWK